MSLLQLVRGPSMAKPRQSVPRLPPLQQCPESQESAHGECEWAGRITLPSYTRIHEQGIWEHWALKCTAVSFPLSLCAIVSNSI